MTCKFNWYNREHGRALYLIRLPAPEPRLEALDLRVEPVDPGTPPPGMADKFFGLLPPKRLADLKPSRALDAAGRGAVLKKAGAALAAAPTRVPGRPGRRRAAAGRGPRR